MLKNLTFIAAACLFATTGCVLTIGGGTDSDSDTAGSTGASAGSTSDSTSGGSTSGSTSDGSGSTSESPTTTASTTASSTTTAASTTDASGSSSGGMSAYGMCGWFAEGNYYACAIDGAMAGVADPNGTFPIDCPDPLPAEGDKCDDMGPITGQGCCLPDGSNYFCDNNGQITKVDCGA